MEEKTSLSEKAFHSAGERLYFHESVKEAINQMIYWGHIDGGNQTLTIDFDKFKELFGEELTK